MSKLLATVVMLAVMGCQDSPIATQGVELADLSFEVPADWRRHDGWRDAAVTASWTPPGNSRKESVTVIRAPRPDGRASRPSLAKLEQTLIGAQRSLRGARVSRVRPIKTEKGLIGARVDVAFTPNGIDRRYRRVHVVLVEDDATLVHVLYTAADPRPDREALDLVVDSMQGGAS